ncbi:MULTISPECIES: RNA-binding S4 domain-containing protein [unclassified Prochlorococcus]|uniref:RNA-binding S4 domain-containing protein n=1 Tax=unclassified Prochlorococcus TaxID=2627481 RepID=UPI0005339FA8|nr:MULTISPECIES: RNA-binding S4 domain-containing protein [unclassified Prochlorococcus]KGG25573.1 S4 domain [Prochlorococcus sp. MIT 0701]KZR64300.1 ribosome-associated protein [Prochlorococcus sp. MIT 1306]
MKLDQFLKWQGWVATGGEAKQLIQSGQVFVNGTVETRRGRHLSSGNRVRLGTDEAVFVGNASTGP